MATPKPTDAQREAAIKRLRYELQLPAESIAKLRAALADEGEQAAPSLLTQEASRSTAGMLDGERPPSQAARALAIADPGARAMRRKPSALELAGFVHTDRKMSALEKLSALITADEAKREAEQSVDAWRRPLERLHGQISDADHIERVSVQCAFDHLNVPMKLRTTGAARRLRKIMLELGWSPARVRGMTKGTYLENIRGYARAAQHVRPLLAAE